MPDKLKVLVLDDERLVRFTIAAYRLKRAGAKNGVAQSDR